VLGLPKRTAVVLDGFTLIRQRWNQPNARSSWCYVPVWQLPSWFFVESEERIYQRIKIDVLWKSTVRRFYTLGIGSVTGRILGGLLRKSV